MELREGEQELYEGHPSWRALFSFYLGGVAIGAAVLAAFWLFGDAFATGLLAGAVIVAAVLAIGYLRRLFTKYLITNRRLRISTGIVARRVQETRLERVQNVNYEQGVFDRMLNVGTVDFDTAGTDDSEFHFFWVNDPERVVRLTDDAIAQATGEGPGDRGGV